MTHKPVNEDGYINAFKQKVGLKSRLITAILVILTSNRLYVSFSSPRLAVLVALSILTLLTLVAIALPIRYQHYSSYLVKLYATCLFLLGMLMLYRRWDFVLVNGSMEGPNGEGSPLAFLFVGMIEQFLFTLPALCMFWAYSKRRVQKWK